MTGNVGSITTRDVGSKASVFLPGESSSSAQLRLLCAVLDSGAASEAFRPNSSADLRLATF